MLKKIDKCGQEVLCWSKRHFGNVRLELEKKRKELKQAERLSVRTGNSDRMRALESEINLLLDMEAQMWRQRSRILWMKDGDRNTKFFHSKASQRRRRNYITKLYDSTSRWCTRESQVNDTILGFYRELFTSANPENLADVLKVIPQVVIESMNASLTREFTIEEVEVAVKEMAPLKAPGPDDIPPLFYQSYWSLVGSDISQSILHYLNTGTLPQSLGHSFITLISKVKNLEYVSQFRPISLSNMLYHIFAKVLANRLKKIMPLLISEHQSAF